MNIRKALDEVEMHPFTQAVSKLHKHQVHKHNSEQLILNYQEEILEQYQSFIIEEFKQYSFSMRIELFENYSKFYLDLLYDKSKEHWREYKQFTLDAVLQHNIMYQTDSADILEKTKEIITDMIDISNSIVNDKYRPCVGDTFGHEPWVDIYFNNEEKSDV